ncbi:MAG TPA: GNAT family N-acetyltransferase [Steroidobacteraceae bacterium]|jgi:GNAT superfamily N-acetyltransferase|nr:GNAT family N-acetyltransferase [Steroidobacteraceae bacterium]
MKSCPFQLRKARHADRPALQALIERSARELGAGDYRPEQIEAALRGAFGVDTQLIDDGTYFVVEADRKLVGCGGWSKRRTLFGGDAHQERDAQELDPKTDAAKIRAFFVDPDYARQGIGRALLERCESEARTLGFSHFELMGTLPGVRLYQALGYVGSEPVHYPVAPGVTIEFVPMQKA